MATDEPGTNSSDGVGSATEAQPPAVDIEQLAERVYRLMKSEVRLERARGVTAGFYRSE
jgi:hypothetical protein